MSNVRGRLIPMETDELMGVLGMNKQAILAAMVAAVAAYATQPAVAQFYNGNEVYINCTDDSPVKQGVCSGYVLGTVDGIWTSQELLNQTKILCLPASATVEQVRDVAIRHLANHPSERQYVAASVIWRAMIEAFPCSE
jgi:hypothetical protein